MEKNDNSNLIIIYFCLIVLFELIIYYCIICYNKFTFTLHNNIRNSVNDIINTNETTTNSINNK